MTDLGKRCALVVLSILSFGAALAMMIWILVFMIKYELSSDSKALYIIVIVAISAFGAVLIYSLYSSCCGGRCSLIILGGLYVTMGAAMVLVGIVVLAMRTPIMNAFYSIWIENVNSDIINSIQTELSCCGFYNSTDYPSGSCSSSLSGCEATIANAIKKNVIIIVSVIAACVILIAVAAAISFKLAATPKEEDNDIQLKQV